MDLLKKLAIITTHPIQYNAPFFKQLNERGRIFPKVFYTWSQAIDGFKDSDFQQSIKWDIPILDGYEWESVPNQAKRPTSKSWSGVDCPSLIRQVLQFQPDAVFIYGWNLKSHFKAIRYFKGKLPVWFTGDSTLLDESVVWKRIIRRTGLKWVYRHVDKAFYVGESNQTYFRKHGFAEKDLVFFPHAVDNERFGEQHDRNYEGKAGKLRSSMGIPGDSIVILFAGKFEQKKNPSLLLEAIRKINTNRKDPVYLVMVGNGHLEEKLKQKAGSDKFIKFMPFQNQSMMPVIYRLGDLFCLPSQGPGETWGLAVNEAMACSRPVVVSDKAGCAIDLVAEGINGRIFRSDDLEKLTEALDSLLAKDLRVMGSQSLRIIYNWSITEKCRAVENAF